MDGVGEAGGGGAEPVVAGAGTVVGGLPPIGANIPVGLGAAAVVEPAAGAGGGGGRGVADGTPNAGTDPVLSRDSRVTTDAAAGVTVCRAVGMDATNDGGGAGYQPYAVAIYRRTPLQPCRRRGAAGAAVAVVVVVVVAGGGV